jgi:photosystem II stability/assembly factor-like uncharacterized protein
MATVYGAMDDAVLLARGGDDDWHADWHRSASQFECLDASPAVPDRIFAGTVEAGLCRSTDGGDSWHEVGAFDDRVTAVTVSPHDPDTVWAGTEPSRVYRSTDGGENWRQRLGLADRPSADRWSFPPRPYPHHVRWIAVAPDDPETLYVAVEAGAFLRSTDGGETWIDHAQGARRDTHTIATHPAAPDRVYAAAGDGYAVSRDRGDSWEYPQAGLDHRYVWSVAVGPNDPESVVVSAATGARSAHDPEGEAAVYRRVGDEPWQVAMDGLPGPSGWGRPVLAAGETHVYALSNRGLFRSEDRRRWTRLDIEWPTAVTDTLPRGLAVVP